MKRTLVALWLGFAIAAIARAQSVVAEVRAKAEGGDAAAQNRLGFLYDKGDGVSRDPTEAVKWYRQAAAQVYPPDQYNLSRMYALSLGVGRDRMAEPEWLRKSAEGGFARAQLQLALECAGGNGAGRDLTEVVKWFRKAAEQGLARAQYNLAFIYFTGDATVPKNLVGAHAWWAVAAACGHPQAAGRMKEIEPEMPQDEIARAKELGVKRLGDWQRTRDMWKREKQRTDFRQGTPARENDSSGR